MEKIDLTKQVQNKNGEVYNVVSLELKGAISTLSIPYDNFIDKYVNYVDPKDAEIARLKLIIDELKAPKTHRKKRLSPEEWKEIEDLIRRGIGNQQIATEYGISDSGVSKKRIAMRSLGEQV